MTPPLCLEACFYQALFSNLDGTLVHDSSNGSTDGEVYVIKLDKADGQSTGHYMSSGTQTVGAANDCLFEAVVEQIKEKHPGKIYVQISCIKIQPWWLRGKATTMFKHCCHFFTGGLNPT